MSDAEIKTVATIIIISLISGLFIGFILLSVYFVNLRKFLSYLKDNHPEKWKELNNPSLFMNASLRNIISTIRFTFSLEYYNDSKLKKFKYKTKRSLIVFLAYFTLLSVLVITIPILFIMGYFG